MVSLLIFPAGSALAGPMADALGAATALIVFAGLSGIPVLLVLLVPAVRGVRRREAGAEVPVEAAAASKEATQPEPERVAA
jgi:hypothetical protein